jgi:uncharacterized protein YyaL (SSP411 family)
LIQLDGLTNEPDCVELSGDDVLSGRTADEVIWRSWSKEAFDEAHRKDRLVLLDLTASWCHWCHVMDRNTYNDPEIASLVNANFVPVRVDIDMRPDISERYNRGGFPTTAFLSEKGESVWGSTYIPPTDMKRVIRSILQAKRSGEIGRALGRGRMPYLDLSTVSGSQKPVTSEDLDQIFEEIFSAYDVEHGGFGIEPKFPHPDVLEILLIRHTEKSDPELLEAATHTLDRMTQGLYDGAEGGLFRYSVTRDWSTPHFEKMLETNVGYLRNLAHAYSVTGNKDFEGHAKGVARYLLGTLRDTRSGGFSGSQDADEEYYGLTAAERKESKAPSIDRTVYAGWNAEAVSAMLASGMLLGENDWVEAGLKAWRNIMTTLWSAERKMLRHQSGEELYLFKDQVSFLHALIEVLQVTGDESLPGLADELVGAVDDWFENDEGGYNDVRPEENAVGELGTPRRPLVENSDWALALATLGSIVHRDDMLKKAKDILSLFGREEVDAHGLFGATYLKARWVVDNGPVAVEIHALPELIHDRFDLCTSAASVVHPAVVVSRVSDDDASRAFAVVCSSNECLPKTEDPERLRKNIMTILAKYTA